MEKRPELNKINHLIEDYNVTYYDAEKKHKIADLCCKAGLLLTLGSAGCSAVTLFANRELFEKFRYVIIPTAMFAGVAVISELVIDERNTENLNSIKNEMRIEMEKLSTNPEVKDIVIPEYENILYQPGSYFYVDKPKQKIKK